MKDIEEIGYFSADDDADHSLWAALSGFVATATDPFGRDPQVGHVTGSAFVLSPDREAVLLTHHAKLHMWLQLGGHCDGIADVPFVALKEAYEESGLRRIQPVGDARRVLDIDIQTIPATAKEPEHLHYDVRYLFLASDLDFTVSAESNALRWVPLGELEAFNNSESLLRLRQRTLDFLC
ncbi:NUDIX domain protein [Tritonibacter multivorans]|uniref:NUDIX domain protein n=1 Tax=Tritonibacter multivorans TaxID=928856 RepID=A0A0P1GI83_9RHOB|nr:NUDIX hydrolase [Tritonibacter multivorans]MDA7420473.1 NUDIX hydrolase [Tritonibacter multivorans]CUH81531.1 NUDIX domain protein [Tritonibacter multivorans]SFC37518.1 hypothetical protein SAMN04488049_102308 [Tritonibacter multivorans]